MIRCLSVVLLLCISYLPSVTLAAEGDPVIVSGTVANAKAKAAILSKLRTVYSNHKVVDQLAVGDVVAPAQWSQMVTQMIGPELQQVTDGEISIQGNAIRIKGNIESDAARQKVLSTLSQAFNSHYAITPSFTVAPSQQSVLDKTLKGRTISFKSGSDVLTDDGKHILNEMATAIKTLNTPFIQVIGNTDNVGKRLDNTQLSLKRAIAVKQYLVDKGVKAANLSVSGMGPDNPIASNDTAAGRARNRRIDFKIYQ